MVSIRDMPRHNTFEKKLLDNIKNSLSYFSQVKEALNVICNFFMNIDDLHQVKNNVFEINN